MIEIRLRTLRKDDHALVYKSWIGAAWDHWRHQTEGCDKCGKRFTYVGKDAFHDGMHARITRLLGSSQCFAVTTPGKEDSDYMIGFLVRHRRLPVLHMLYVVGGWRRMGAAAASLGRAFPRWPDEGIAYTQDTRTMPHVRKKWNAQFNPFLLEG